MDMEEGEESLFIGEVLVEGVGKGMGQERDQTGIEIGGGGATCLLFCGWWWGCGRENALTTLINRSGSSIAA
jgi:hypothetical protein